MTGWRRPSFAWRFDRNRVRELVSFGFPLMLQAQIWLLFMGIDNLIVAGFISVKELGYYALAVSVTRLRAAPAAQHRGSAVPAHDRDVR